jgi:hypothetical protein
VQRTGKLAFAARMRCILIRRARPSASSASRSRTKMNLRVTASRCSFYCLRPRTGEKARSIHDLVDLVVRAAHEQELFPPNDWEFIQWIADTLSRTRWRRPRDACSCRTPSCCNGLRVGDTPTGSNSPATASRCNFTARSFRSRRIWKTATRNFRSHIVSRCRTGNAHSVADAKFFNQQPPLALVGNTFFLLRNAPPSRRAEISCAQTVRGRPQIEPPAAAASAQDAVEPRRGLGTALRSRIRRRRNLFLNCSTTRCGCDCSRKSERDQSLWFWNGNEWVPTTRKNVRTTNRKFSTTRASNPRRNGCASWIGSRPNPVCGSATRMKIFSARWPQRGRRVRRNSEFLGNPAFHRLFLTPRQLKPKLIVKGSGIDWLSVSAEWEGRGFEIEQGRSRTARRRNGTFCETAEFRLGRTRHRRRARRARGDGRHGRGRPDRRAAKSRPGKCRASGR